MSEQSKEELISIEADVEADKTIEYVGLSRGMRYLGSAPREVWEEIKALRETNRRLSDEHRDAQRYRHLRAHWEDFTGITARDPGPWLDATIDAVLNLGTKDQS